jgi:hypothetical protein
MLVGLSSAKVLSLLADVIYEDKEKDVGLD